MRNCIDDGPLLKRNHGKNADQGDVFWLSRATNLVRWNETHITTSESSPETSHILVGDRN